MAGVIRDAIHAFKYGNYRGLAPQLANLLVERLKSSQIPATLLIPVPMHRSRLRRRGYNQALLLARKVSEATGIPMADDVLIRTVNSPPQVAMTTGEARYLNAKASFTAVKDVHGEALLLIDDVVTTGSTMAACAQVAGERGAASVWGLALAREGRRNFRD